MDWQEDLDDYLAWTREQEALDAAQAIVTQQRARALARMHAAGLTQDRIAYVVGLSKARVGQLLNQAQRPAESAVEASGQPA